MVDPKETYKMAAVISLSANCSLFVLTEMFRRILVFRGRPQWQLPTSEVCRSRCRTVDPLWSIWYRVLSDYSALCFWTRVDRLQPMRLSCRVLQCWLWWSLSGGWKGLWRIDFWANQQQESPSISCSTKCSVIHGLADASQMTEACGLLSPWRRLLEYTQRRSGVTGFLVMAVIEVVYFKEFWIGGRCKLLTY